MELDNVTYLAIGNQTGYLDTTNASLLLSTAEYNNSSHGNTTPVDIAMSTVAMVTGDVVFPPVAWHVFEGIHAVLTTLALVINCLSLGVIYGVVVRLTPPLQVLTSVGFTDMLAPWAVMTAYFPESACQQQIHSALMLLAHNAGALSLLTYAVVHSIATYRPLQYERIVTPRRLWVIINLIWVVATVTANLHFLVVLMHQEPGVEYCRQVQGHLQLSLIMTAAILATTVLVTTLVYGRLFMHLRPLEALANTTSTEPRQSTKGVVTGVLLISTFLLGWGPYLIAKLEDIRQEPHRHPNVLIGLSTAQVFVLLMCAMRPLVYGHRMTNMYMGYHRLYQRTRGWFISSWTRVRSKAEGDDQPSTPLNPIESIC